MAPRHWQSHLLASRLFVAVLLPEPCGGILKLEAEGETLAFKKKIDIIMLILDFLHSFWFLNILYLDIVYVDY